MIEVVVTLHSAITGHSTRLASGVICNDGTGTNRKGNYTVQFGGRKGKGKSGKVKDYPRLDVSVWNLVRRALEEAGYTK